MGTMQKTAIIVPCYNESLRFMGQEFADYAKDNEEVYFIFVDDGSTDDTKDKINVLCRSNPEQILCLSLKKNHGKAEAVRHGFLKAIEMDFENIGFWDVDLSTPLKFINKFCELFDDHGITGVMGSRVRLLGHRIERGALRHYAGRIFATLASIVLEIPVYDTQCGAKVFAVNSDMKRVFSKPFKVNWTFDVEILARYKLINKDTHPNIVENTFVEYPLEQWIHVPGSKIRIRDFLVVGVELIKIFLLLRAPGVSDRYMKQFMT